MRVSMYNHKTMATVTEADAKLKLNNETTIAEAQEKYDFLKFTVADINGIARTKTITKHVMKDYLRHGMPFHIGEYNE